MQTEKTKLNKHLARVITLYFVMKLILQENERESIVETRSPGGRKITFTNKICKHKFKVISHLIHTKLA